MTLHRLLLVLTLALGSFGAGACSGASDACGAPPAVTYSCAPAAAGVSGCKGFAADAGGSAAEAAETFLEGCTARLPRCLPAYPDSVETCTCTSFAGGAPTWICPM